MRCTNNLVKKFVWEKISNVSHCYLLIFTSNIADGQNIYANYYNRREFNFMFFFLIPSCHRLKITRKKNTHTHNHSNDIEFNEI